MVALCRKLLPVVIVGVACASPSMAEQLRWEPADSGSSQSSGVCETPVETLDWDDVLVHFCSINCEQERSNCYFSCGIAMNGAACQCQCDNAHRGCMTGCDGKTRPEQMCPTE
jgi:hypothetical protein